MKYRQLHGDTWQNLCAGANRNIDTFIGIRMVAPVDEGKTFPQQSVSTSAAFFPENRCVNSCA
jgi:hypothetical protein